MVKSLPYELQEGQVAYARKVMANLKYLLGLLNNITVDGKTGDLNTVLQELFDRAVLTGEANSEDITFKDGESLQNKYDSGQTTLALMTGEGMFYFYVKDGRLKVVTNGNINADDFQIDGNGHLIYTVNPSTETAEPVEYDLGRVKGDNGEPGEGGMLASIYDPRNKKKDLCHYFGRFQCNWNSDGTATITDDNLYPNDDSLVGDVTEEEKILKPIITATEGHFMFKPKQGSTVEEWKAWWDANVICTGQHIGGFDLKALGKVPPNSIDLDVDVWK